MRTIIVALLLAIALGTASAVPLEGSNANSTVVIFGSSRMPVADENSTLEILKVDVGIMGAENASYELIDQNDTIYSPGLYRTLSSGKQIVYFLTEKDSLFKLINATPDVGGPIYINWWKTPNGSNDKMIIRYYGTVDSSINSDEQMIVAQVRVQNNGAEDLYVTPLNFTLFDQWGWPYKPALGFDPETVAPGSATSDRVLIGFLGLSPTSRPTALAYDYGTPGQIVIEFERDSLPLSDEVVYGIASAASSAPATMNDSSAVALESALAAPANQTQGAETAPAAASESAGPDVGSIKDQLAASKARLEAARMGLDSMTQESNDTAATAVAQNNSTSVA
ncbi:MAG: DUF4352 domain-containing protein [Methanothrix sp.]|jgi:hypothetical protein|nr:DUF4352 domain-containing protein [Methanothrix sp.]